MKNKNHNIRFSMEKEDERRAWEFLHSPQVRQIPERCQTCLACVHHCSLGAMRLKVPEKNPNARYRNENIDLEEIMAANNQNQQTIELKDNELGRDRRDRL